MAYVHNAPWYYAADGTPVQAVATEEGWTFPQAPVDDDGAQIRVIDDPAEVLALNTQALGFNPDDKRVNPDQSVSIMNPQTGQYEQAVAAGESGALMPISMAQAQNLPIYQYAQEPKDTGTLGQFTDLTKVVAPFAGMGALSSLAMGGLAGATGAGGSALDGGIDWAAQGALDDAAMGQTFLDAGGVIPAGSGYSGSVYGTLGDGLGSNLLESTAAANEAAAGAEMTAAGAGATAGAGLGGNLYNAAGGVGTAGTALTRLLAGTATAGDVASLAGKVAPALLGAYASNQQSGELASLAREQSALGAPSRARYEASMTPGFNPTSIPGYQGAVDNAMETTLRKLSTQGNPFGNPGGLIEANKSVVAGTALPALQTYQNQNSQSGGYGSINAAAPGTAAASIGSNANMYNAIGYGIDQATAEPSSLDALLKRLASKTTPAYGLA